MSKNIIDKLLFFRDIFLQASAAMGTNRLRTILSILGVAVGIAAVLVVDSVGKGGKLMIFKELETFGLKSAWVFRNDEEKDPERANRFGTGIDNDDYYSIDSQCCPAISKVSPVVFGIGGSRRTIIRVSSRFSNAPIAGVGSDYPSIDNDQIEFGRQMRIEDVLRRRKVALIGSQVHEDLFGANTNPVGKEMRIGEEKFEVIGVLAPKSRSFLASIGAAGGQDANNRILIPFTVLQQMRGGQTEIQVLQFETTSLDHTQAALSQIVNQLQRRHGNHFSYKTQSMSQYISTTERIMQGVSIIGIIAATVSLFVGGIGIMNIMSTSVLERTSEIGLRKALGGARNDILQQFLIEAILISTIGGILGMILGGGAIFVLSLLAKLPLMPSVSVVIVALIISMSIGLVSGYYPAFRAARLRPVDALRHD